MAIHRTAFLIILIAFCVESVLAQKAYQQPISWADHTQTYLTVGQRYIKLQFEGESEKIDTELRKLNDFIAFENKKISGDVYAKEDLNKFSKSFRESFPYFEPIYYERVNMRRGVAMAKNYNEYQKREIVFDNK